MSDKLDNKLDEKMESGELKKVKFSDQKQNAKTSSSNSQENLEQKNSPKNSIEPDNSKEPKNDAKTSAVSNEISEEKNSPQNSNEAKNSNGQKNDTKTSSASNEISEQKNSPKNSNDAKISNESKNNSNNESKKTTNNLKSKKSLANISKIRKQKLADLILQNAKKDDFKNVFFTLTSKIFSIFFPEAIKKHVSQKISCIGGFIVAIILLLAFLYIFFFNQCITLYLEIGQKDQLEDYKVLECNETFLQSRNLAAQISRSGKWYFENDGIIDGPWIVFFSGFETNQENFTDGINFLMDQANEKIYSLAGQPFFKIIQEMQYFIIPYFGKSGFMELRIIFLPDIFSQFKFQGFGKFNLSQNIQENFDEYGLALLNSTWEILQTQNCQQSAINAFQNSPWTCYQGQGQGQNKGQIEAVVSVQGQVSKQFMEQQKLVQFPAPKRKVQVTTTLFNFYETLNDFLFPGSYSSTSPSTEQRLQFNWEFYAFFYLDYCNNLGVENNYLTSYTYRFDIGHDVNININNNNNSNNIDNNNSNNNDNNNNNNINNNNNNNDNINNNNNNNGNINAQQVSEWQFMYDSNIPIKHLHCDASEWLFEENISVSAPYTLTTGIESCKVQQCPSVFDKLATAQANTQIAYLGVLVVSVLLFFCVFVPWIRARQMKQDEKLSEMLYEAIQSVAEGTVDAAGA